MGFFGFLFGKKEPPQNTANLSAAEMMAEANANGVNFKTHNEYSSTAGKAETEKAINTLRGILKGIDIDQEINKNELQELVNWCRVNEHLRHREPINDYCKNIDAANDSGDVVEILNDLVWAVDNYTNDNPYYKDFTVDVQVLQGICHGILADGRIQEKEIRGLEQWLDDNSQLENYYPYYELRQVVGEVLKDGIIEEKEKLLLKAHFNQFANLATPEFREGLNNELVGIKTKGYCALNPQIEIDGRKFCATGDFSFKSKEEFYSIVDEFGGISSNNITNATNYLVVGGKGSTAWCFSCYGRKVERAISMKNRGMDIQIVQEDDFWGHLESQ